MKHRLIIVEGLPCSGKSTAARFLAEQCGMTFVDEGTGAHPADYENHAFLTKKEFLTLADMIGYPITINGTELKDSDAFLDYMKDKTVANSDWNAMMDENLLDMFVNGQGLCMGSGQGWLNDPGYMTDKEPELKIIAISGIVDQDSEEAQIPEEEGDFYDNPSVTVYDEAGESHTLYESSDGYWREEDGTTYIKLSDTEFQLKDGGETLHVR